MKRLIVWGIIAAPSLACAQDFDIAQYCAQVSKAVGGSYAIEASCRAEENSAKTTLEGGSIDPTIREYCYRWGTVLEAVTQRCCPCTDRESRSKPS